MAKAKAKAVAKRKKTEVAVLDADAFAQAAGQGVTDLGEGDLAMPMIKSLQKVSPELDDHADAKPGDIYNSVTQERVSGSEGIRVVNCAYSLTFIEWEPRGTGSGAPFAIYSAGDKLPATERGEDNKDYVVDGGGRYLERTAQHYILVFDDEGMTQQALLPMKSTQLKKSRQWNSAMKATKMQDSRGALFVPPRFSHIWRLTTALEENKNGSWYGWAVTKEGVIKDPALYAEARQFHESIVAGQVKVRHVREEDRTDDDENIPF
jgi:hypothetical protein